MPLPSLRPSSRSHRYVLNAVEATPRASPAAAKKAVRVQQVQEQQMPEMAHQKAQSETRRPHYQKQSPPPPTTPTPSLQDNTMASRNDTVIVVDANRIKVMRTISALGMEDFSVAANNTMHKHVKQIRESSTERTSFISDDNNDWDQALAAADDITVASDRTATSRNGYIDMELFNSSLGDLNMISL